LETKYSYPEDLNVYKSKKRSKKQELILN